MFTVTADVQKAEWNRLRHSYLRDFSALALHVHQKVLKLSGVGAPGILSPRELQCLQGFANGRKPKQIADDFRISESAVRQHLVAARDKLGCQTYAQLVGKAVAGGLVTVA